LRKGPARRSHRTIQLSKSRTAARRPFTPSVQAKHYSTPLRPSVKTEMTRFCRFSRKNADSTNSARRIRMWERASAQTTPWFRRVHTLHRRPVLSTMVPDFFRGFLQV